MRTCHNVSYPCKDDIIHNSKVMSDNWLGEVDDSLLSSRWLSILVHTYSSQKPITQVFLQYSSNPWQNLQPTPKFPTLETEGLFTLWTTKLSISDGLFPWSHFHGPTSGNCNFKSLGPLTRCTPNVNQEKWPCIQKSMFFSICLKKEVLGLFFHN